MPSLLPVPNPWIRVRVYLIDIMFALAIVVIVISSSPACVVPLLKVVSNEFSINNLKNSRFRNEQLRPFYPILLPTIS